MARFDQERASARSDNRRMTGNVNIYICSEAIEKGKKNVEIDTESAFSHSQTTKINLNPSNIVSNKLNKTRNGNDNLTNNREKLIMTTEFNERQSHEVKFRSNDGNSDEKHKLSGIASCRCPQYDESDLWLRNLKNKQERKAVAGVKHEEKKAIEKMKSSSKDKDLLVIKYDQKLGSAKNEAKVSKREKKKEKVKESKKSYKNNTYGLFSYFRCKSDVDAKEDIIDEDLCTCKWRSKSPKNKNKKYETKKRKKDKDDKKLISSKKPKKDHHKSESKNADDRSKQKIANDNDVIRKTETSNEIKNLDEKNKEKHSYSKKSKAEHTMTNEKLSTIASNNVEKLPKTPGNRKIVFDRKPALKKNNENRSSEKDASSKEISFDTNKKKKSSVQKVKVKKKTNAQEDSGTTHKSKSNADNSKDETENQNSFFFKFFNVFKSKRNVPQKHTKKKKSKCDESCSELKKTAKTSSSVQRKNKSRRKRHKSELAGKMNGQKFTEKAIISSNKSNIQVNEQKSCHVNVFKNIEEKSENLKPKDVIKEPEKGNLKRTNSEESKTNKVLQTEYSQMSLRICFSCLFPSGNCLCRRNFPKQESCDCRKVTFCCDENCQPSNNKIPYGSAILPYQKLKNYPKVVNEMQGKMNESVNNSKHSCCSENNHNERCTYTCKECDDDCTDKKPRAKCYYCKNLPCRCGCLIKTPGYSSNQQ